MLRYYLISAALVLAALIAILNLPHGPGGGGDVRYSSGGGTPGPPQKDDRPGTPGPTRGEAPWALDVLPECFFELSHASGSPAFIAAKRPPAERVLPAGSVVRVADCTLTIGAGTAVVTRGADRLVVPPLARFYGDGPKRVVLDRVSRGREEVRVFELRGGEGDGPAPKP